MPHTAVRDARTAAHSARTASRIAAAAARPTPGQAGVGGGLPGSTSVGRHRCSRATGVPPRSPPRMIISSRQPRQACRPRSAQPPGRACPHPPCPYGRLPLDLLVASSATSYLRPGPARPGPAQSALPQASERRHSRHPQPSIVPYPLRPLQLAGHGPGWASPSAAARRRAVSCAPPPSAVPREKHAYKNGGAGGARVRVPGPRGAAAHGTWSVALRTASSASLRKAAFFAAAAPSTSVPLRDASSAIFFCCPTPSSEASPPARPKMQSIS
jgi:hypothetical protein